MSEHAPTHALVRRVSPSLADCALTYLARRPIELERAVHQHQVYVSALERAGLHVTVLPAQPSLPDAAFVEDMAVILDEFIIAGRSGSTNRRKEADSLLPLLNGIRPVELILPPGILEGGDLLVVGKTIFAGLSSRTNEEGVRQLERMATPHGYRVAWIPVRGCLHLKTAITRVGQDIVLANPRWIDLLPFVEFEILNVPDSEPWGANTLLVNGTLLVTNSAPRTAELLESRGCQLSVVDISELQKAEAGLTCLSLLYRKPDGLK